MFRTANIAEETALVIIDVQTGLVEGWQHEPVWEREKLLANLQALLAKARAHQVPVIYIQDDDVGPVDSAEWQIHPAIAPQSGDTVIRKLATDAFHGTTLHQELSDSGIAHIVVAGCKTEYCVDTACRRATTLGYDVTLVCDAHSTTANGVLSAEQIIAHHNRNLHGLSNLDHFIMVKRTDEIDF